MTYNKNFTIVDQKKIKKIKSKLSSKNSARIILHNRKSSQQEMLIAQKKYYFYPVKKNIQSDQTFTIISGRLLILIFNNHGKLKKKIFLSKNKNIICRVKKNTYHCDISLSKFSLHLETKHGLFTKKTNYIGNFPKTNQIIKKLIKKY